MPPSTTPHMPGTSASVLPFITWQVDVPMIASICPGRTACAAGAVTCASTLPTATAIPAGSPVHAAALGESFPAASPSCLIGAASLSAAKLAKAGFSVARNASSGYRPSW